MAGVNKVIVLGNLGQDPELHEMKGGNKVCRLNIATTRRWLSKETKETVEETEWHRVSVWGAQADPCMKYLKKGRQVYVEGRLRTSSYEKDGVKRYSTEIVADTVQFIGGKDGGSQSGGGGDTPVPQQQGNAPDEDDNIEF